MSEPSASSRTGRLLTGRRSPRQRRRKRDEDAPGHRTEIGPATMVADYEAGPFPHQAVHPFPAELVILLERRTGRTFPAELLAEYERVRAFLAYSGIDLSPELEARQRLGDDRDRGAPVAAELPARAAHLAARQPVARPEVPSAYGQPDPTDLGDD